MATMQLREQVALDLRTLYRRCGYTQYTMGKFEEYDLYARNKDFLVSDNVITFTDPSGKLMALKPDVTLSIVKNTTDRPNSVKKLYYHENVYRPAKGSRNFREIMQVGLEVLGRIDPYCIAEVLTLADKSLRVISQEAVLCVSHLGVLSELMESIAFPVEKRSELVGFISQKNLHELTALCRQAGVSQSHTDILQALVTTSGAPAQVLPRLETLLAGLVSEKTLAEMTAVIQALSDLPTLRLDFSMVDDLNYYSGFVFKGFLRELPGSVLSGGQYDKLMKKMNRCAGAIGFAVYLDALERLEQQGEAYDVDTVLLYPENVPLKPLRQAVEALQNQYPSVLALPEKPRELRCRQILQFDGKEVQNLG